MADEPYSTPKLTLSKLPYCKPRDLPPCHMKTPPLRSSVSVPFLWEEAPGKPRASAPPPKNNKVAAAARCLDLPPRLLHDDHKFTVMPSPTTVLDGPYVGRSLSLACTFSFRKGPPLGREDGPRPAKRSSERWGIFKEEGKPAEGSLDFSHSLGDIFKSEDGVRARVGRKRSFFRLSPKYFWTDICTNVKVPWRRRKSRATSASI